MFLKQSTSVVIPFGPFVDKTDGVTLETGMVSALDNGTTGIMLSKNGGTLAVRSATVTASTYDAHGCYKVTLSTTDTGTLGSLRVIYTEPATCLAVWRDFEVVAAHVYDGLVAGGDYLQVDTKQINSAGIVGDGNATPWDGA
jgi:carbohydrate-binding DOMON domain-containing protein